MFHHTRSATRRHLDSIRHDPARLFAGLLDPRWVTDALRQEGARWRDGGVYSPAITLWTFLGQILHPDHSCRAAVARLMARLLAHGEAPCSPETGPYCKARRRLPVGVLQRLTRRSAQALDHHADPAWLFKGRAVRIVDGTTVSMPDTPGNQKAFPQNPAQKPGLGFPIARLVALMSLATGVVTDLAIGPYLGKETGETALLRRLWDCLRRGEILLGDRFFSSYFGIAALPQRGVDAVFRMHQRRRVDFRRGRRLGRGDHVVFWDRPKPPAWMDQATCNEMPTRLELREVRVNVAEAGFRVRELVLVTTLLDPEEFSKADLAALYLRRWHIELDLRAIKVEMGMDVLRCKTPELVEKEIWAHLLAYNLVRTAMAEAARLGQTTPRRLSFRGAWQTLLAFQDEGGGRSGRRRGGWAQAQHQAMARHRVGVRPGRSEPRAVKRRPKQRRYLMVPRSEARKSLSAKQ